MAGDCGKPEYRSWESMKYRCLNPNCRAYKDYGGRGIGVYGPWIASFAQFLEDVGPRPTLDHCLERIDNNGDYSPGNVRWATPLEQGSNKRNNRVIEFAGETLTLAQWARRVGVHRQVIRWRLNAGWPIERILDPRLELGRTHWLRRRTIARLE